MNGRTARKIRAEARALADPSVVLVKSGMHTRGPRRGLRWETHRMANYRGVVQELKALLKRVPRPQRNAWLRDQLPNTAMALADAHRAIVQELRQR